MLTFDCPEAGSEGIDSPRPCMEGRGEVRIGADPDGVEKIHLIDLTSRYA